MTKEFQEAVYTRSRFKNKMNKNPTMRKFIKDNETCVSLLEEKTQNVSSTTLQKRHYYK